jgi:hypothetical protein
MRALQRLIAGVHQAVPGSDEMVPARLPSASRRLDIQVALDP